MDVGERRHAAERMDKRRIWEKVLVDGRQLLLRCALAKGADHAIDIPCLSGMVSTKETEIAARGGRDVERELKCI